MKSSKSSHCFLRLILPSLIDFVLLSSISLVESLKLIYCKMNCLHYWKSSLLTITLFQTIIISQALKCLVGDNDPLLHVGNIDYGNGTVIGQKPNYFKEEECPGYTYLCVSIEAGKN